MMFLCLSFLLFFKLGGCTATISSFDFKEEKKINFSYFNEDIFYFNIQFKTKKKEIYTTSFSLTFPRFEYTVADISDTRYDYEFEKKSFDNPDILFCSNSTDEMIKEKCGENDGFCVDSEVESVFPDIYCFKPSSKEYTKSYTIDKVNSKYILEYNTVNFGKKKIDLRRESSRIAITSEELFFKPGLGIEDNWILKFFVNNGNPLTVLSEEAYKGKVIVCDKDITADGRECFSVKKEVLDNVYKEDEIKSLIECNDFPKKIIKFNLERFKSLITGVSNRTDFCLNNFMENNFLKNLCDCEGEEKEENMVSKVTDFDGTFEFQINEPHCVTGIMDIETMKCGGDFNCTNDCYGHGECVSDPAFPLRLDRGICICEPGYSQNYDCLYAVCYGITASSPYVCSGMGSCNRPDHCVCSDESQYKGSLCDIPHCSISCKNGHCSRPEVCKCNYGYKGDDCSEHECLPACLNDGICESVDNCNCTQDRTYGASCGEKIGSRFVVVNSKQVRLEYVLETTHAGVYLFEKKSFPCSYIIKNSAPIFGTYPQTACSFMCDEESKKEDPDEDSDEDSMLPPTGKCPRTKYLVIDMMKTPRGFFNKKKVAEITPITAKYSETKKNVVKIEFKPTLTEKAKVVVQKHISSALMVTVIVASVLCIVSPILLAMCLCIACLVLCQVCLLCFRVLNIMSRFYAKREQFTSFKRMEDNVELEDEIDVGDGNRRLLETENRENQELGSIIQEVDLRD